jgi:hypothetical protein
MTLTGMDAQHQFARRMREDTRLTVINAPTRSNMDEHYDYTINGVRVEFKGPKSVYSGGPIDHTRKLLEWVAVDAEVNGTEITGRIGWLHGKADYLVFDECDTYVWVPREGAKALVSHLDWANPIRNGRPYPADYVVYQRWDNHRALAKNRGVTCLVPRADILGIPGTVVSPTFPADLGKGFSPRWAKI